MPKPILAFHPSGTEKIPAGREGTEKPLKFFYV